MLHKLRRRAEDEQGFTLIELLVVILIIAILAAVAIPTFLNQRGKAYDSNAQTAAKDAQIAEETYATNNDGSYTTNWSDLAAIDPSLGGSSVHGSVTTPSGDNYQIVVTAEHTGDLFTLTDQTDGTQTKTCSGGTGSGQPGACSSSHTW